MKLALALTFALTGPAVAGDVSSSAPPPKAPQPARSDCEKFGASFADLLGTDTCVKVGGRIRADYLTSTFKAPAPVVPSAQAGAAAWKRSPHSTFHTGADLLIDTRTQTDFGTVRTYVEIHNAQ